MSIVYKKLRLDSASKCSKNVWFSLLGILTIVFVNFNAQIMRLWILIIIAVAITTYSFISFLGFTYWTVASWGNFRTDVRVVKFCYGCILALASLVTIYILSKIFNMLDYPH